MGKLSHSFGRYPDTYRLGNYGQPQTHLRVAYTPSVYFVSCELVDRDLQLFEKIVFFKTIIEIHLSCTRNRTIERDTYIMVVAFSCPLS